MVLFLTASKRLTAKVRPMVEANGVFEVEFSSPSFPLLNMSVPVLSYIHNPLVYGTCGVKFFFPMAQHDIQQESTQSLHTVKHTHTNTHTHDAPAGIGDRQQHAAHDQAQPGSAVVRSEIASS
jgi:hypothetical protein